MFAVFKDTIILASECKFGKEPVGIDVLEDLESKATNLHGDRTIRFLFAREDFTEAVKALANDRDDLYLATTDDLYQHAKSE